jgi:gamma-glutamyltranspeptidase
VEKIKLQPGQDASVAPGTLRRNPVLAASLAAIAAGGAAALHEGPLAEAIVAAGRGDVRGIRSARVHRVRFHR